MSNSREQLHILDDEEACGCKHERRKDRKQCPKSTQVRRFGCAHRLENESNEGIPSMSPINYQVGTDDSPERRAYVTLLMSSEKTLEESTPYHEYIDELVAASKLEAAKADQLKKLATDLHVHLRAFDMRSSELADQEHQPDTPEAVDQIKRDQEVVIAQLKDLKEYLLSL